MSKKTVCFNFYNFFCQCQDQSFSTRSLGKAFLGQQEDLLSWLYFVRYLLLPFFVFFLNCSPILVTHPKIFYVTATLKIKVVLVAAEELANLKSLKVLEFTRNIHYLARTLASC